MSITSQFLYLPSFISQCVEQEAQGQLVVLLPFEAPGDGDRGQAL